jgi:hypothetical protein
MLRCMSPEMCRFSDAGMTGPPQDEVLCHHHGKRDEEHNQNQQAFRNGRLLGLPSSEYSSKPAPPEDDFPSWLRRMTVRRSISATATPSLTQQSALLVHSSAWSAFVEAPQVRSPRLLLSRTTQYGPL